MLRTDTSDHRAILSECVTDFDYCARFNTIEFSTRVGEALRID